MSTDNRTDDTPLELSGLSVRTANTCESVGLRTIGDVRAYGPRRMLTVHGFGKTSYRELVRMLSDVPPSVSGDVAEAVPGISLRDYFAAAALTGLLAKEGCTADTITRAMAGTNKVRDASMFAPDDAERCYIIADAMLAARNPTT